MKNVFKRSLSLMLTVVMLFTCWVFAAPKASASTTKYKFRILVKATNDFGIDESQCSYTLYYKSNNGTASSESTTTGGITNNVNSQKNIFTSGSANFGYFPSNEGADVDGFPTAFKVTMYKSSNALWNTAGSIDAYLQVAKNGSDWSSYGGTATNNGNIGDGYLSGLASGSGSISGKGSFNTGKKSVGTGSYPRPTTDGDTSFSDVTFPKSGSASSTTGVPSVVDQYDVIYKDANFSLTSASSDYSSCTPSISDLTVTVPTQVSTSGDNEQTITVACKWASGSSSGARTFNKTFTVTDATYTATYKYNSTNPTYSSLASPVPNTISGSYTAQYGDKPSKPTLPVTAYYTNTKHWSGGSYTAPTLTGDQDVWPSYSKDGVAHSYTYSEISNNDTDHTASCSCGYSETNAHAYSGTWTSYDDTYHKDTCGSPRACGHVKYQAHSYGQTTFSFASDGKTATASRTCSVCNHTQTASATMSHTTKTAATCTDKGWTTYIATSPFANESNVKDSVDKEDIPIDSTNHNFATATVKEAALRTAKTCTSDATYWYSCSRCGEVSVEGDASSHYFTDEGSALGHDYSDWETITAATCTEIGSEQRTCARCENTEARDIPALGHDRYEIYNAPTNGSAGSVCYGCRNCSKYWTATYDSSTETYTPATEYNTLVLAKRNTPASGKVAAPKFNDFYNEIIDYNYAMRGASLKIAEPFDFSDRNTRQGLRFTASLHVPDGVTYTEDNNIVDFGFIYSQTNFVNNNINNLTIESVRSDRKIARMSVADNNSDKGPFDGTNWTGVTAHEDEIYGGTTLTFNLLVNIKAYNWTSDYCARAYVIYNYNGHQYTVYDNQFSSRSIEYIARAAVDNPDETLKVRNFCQDKILTPIDEGWITPNS